MSDKGELIFVIDDDTNVRSTLTDFFDSVGLHSVTLASVEEYLARPRAEQPSCLVLDIALPDMSGLEFQAKMHGEDHPPIVFLTGHSDIPSSVSAMKRGAVDYLIKPFAAEALLNAVRAAFELDRKRLLEKKELATLKARLDGLTKRELEVLPLVVSGLLNKQAAAELGISEITFQVHRGKVMQKMKADSLADLVRMATKLRVSTTLPRHNGASVQ